MAPTTISAFLFMACLTFFENYAFLTRNDVLITETINIRVPRSSAVSANKMPTFYDVTFKLNGKEINARLRKIISNSNARRDPEGHVVLKGTPYAVEPEENYRGPVMYRLQNEHRIEEDTSERRQKRSGRTKRNPKRPLCYKVAIMVDGEAVSRAQDGGISERSAKYAIKQMVTMAAMYVEECFKSFRSKIDINFVITEIDFLPKGDITDEDHRTVDGYRRTACAEKIMQEIRKLPIKFWNRRDHALLLTGFDLLNLVGDNSIRGKSNYGTVCSPESLSVVEFSFTMDMARLIARYIVTSLGAKMDKPSGAHKTHIMTPNAHLSPYEAGTNLFSYSEETASLVHDFVTYLPRYKRSKTCLREGSLILHLKLPSSTIAEKYTYDEQCQFAGYVKAVGNQRPLRICEQGIQCIGKDKSQVYIMPMVGTKCGARNDGVRLGSYMQKTRYYCMIQI